MKSKYRFDRTISREVLENYLARAITQLGLSHSAQRDEDIRMLKNVGAKFIGRAAYLWGNPGDDDKYFARVAETNEFVHKADPDMIVQGCIFEAIYDGVSKVPIPAWLFEEFGQKAETRNFNYDAMLFDNGKWKNHWGKGASVPDMSKLETRMWFCYRARRYIDSGCEALHFGQVHLMAANDKDFRYWREMLDKVRHYGSEHARRHIVLCDAHTHGIVCDGKLLFDWHAFPLRVKDVVESPMKGILEVNYTDALYGKSKGGITPSGWSCGHLPYIVEFDNWGSSGRGGKHIEPCWVWGYDEIDWFARLPENERNEWLRYADKWIREHDPNGHLQMPGQRCIHDPIGKIYTYYCNTKSTASPNGFNQEETIKQIWSAN